MTLCAGAREREGMMNSQMNRMDRSRAGRRARRRVDASTWLAAAAAAVMAPSARAAVIYQSGTMGPTGVGGSVLDSGTFIAARLQPTLHATANAAGGHAGAY